MRAPPTTRVLSFSYLSDLGCAATRTSWPSTGRAVASAAFCVRSIRAICPSISPTSFSRSSNCFFCSSVRADSLSARTAILSTISPRFARSVASFSIKGSISGMRRRPALRSACPRPRCGQNPASAGSSRNSGSALETQHRHAAAQRRLLGLVLAGDVTLALIGLIALGRIVCRVELRIPIEAGRVFRGEAGRRSDLKAATIPN